MAEKTYLGLPRNEIDWSPRINYELCINCGVCLEKCDHKVYAKDGEKVIVAQPYECVVGCESCRHRCPTGAISFPTRDDLKLMLRALRKKYGYG